MLRSLIKVAVFIPILSLQFSAFADESRSVGLNNGSVISPELHDFYIAKTLSGFMNAKQISDCAALNETSADDYRKMEAEGEFPVETIRKVELRGQNFWVTAYGLASGQNISYEELITLSHYFEEYRSQKMRGEAPTQAFGEAVMQCAAQKKRAAYVLNKKHDFWGMSEEQVMGDD